VTGCAKFGADPYGSSGILFSSDQPTGLTPGWTLTRDISKDVRHAHRCDFWSYNNKIQPILRPKIPKFGKKMDEEKFSTKNRLTVAMLISKLPLIVMVAHKSCTVYCIDKLGSGIPNMSLFLSDPIITGQVT